MPLTVVSCHLDPFRPEVRFSEAARIASLAAGNAAVVGGDFSGPGAERRPGGTYYDPDPLERRGWHEAAIYQVAWDEDPDAPPRVDRRAAERLRRAGLSDAACVLDAPWQATCGHWPDDPHGERRTDRVLATAAAAPALTGYRVIDTEIICPPSGGRDEPELRLDPASLSDHLPVVVELDESLLQVP